MKTNTMSSLFGLVEVYKCECRPDFIYKTKNTFKAHRKNKRHSAWEIKRTQRNVRCREKELENQNEVLKNQLKERDDLIKELQGQIQTLFTLIK